ncbi:uncharacterized protein CMU_010660 [Cryptosporidium muris RN66]|uniref:Uncharacterized protein n=1 Tax=Cryptosporidium muris (strain RN66) TaxID=441375 RepID=B6AIS7_CRYMR|nr:uncharacterized protein CMU_010660 [Cryptosporidium muris RN66]EEA08118.1 hypothetical protein, conserved [Cryptosporidium muris RN66]|eukprot:XP_002142467.1 hypothetical protein [Cryptosporidium muris RN66]
MSSFLWIIYILLIFLLNIDQVWNISEQENSVSFNMSSNSLESIAKWLLSTFEKLAFPGIQNETESVTEVVYGPFFYEVDNVSLPLNITSLTGGSFSPVNPNDAAQYYYESFVTEPFTAVEERLPSSFESRKVIRGGVGAPNGTYIFFQEEIQLLSNDTNSTSIDSKTGGNSSANLLNGNPNTDFNGTFTIPSGSISINGTNMPVGTTAFGPVTFPNGAILPLGASLPNGTLLASGTVLSPRTTLPGGTIFPGGATFITEKHYSPTLKANTNCYLIGASTYGSNCQVQQIKKSTSNCCSSNILCYSPAGFSNMTALTIPAGSVLQPGSNLPSNSLLLGSLTISTNTFFGSGAILPDGNIINPNTTLPFGTTLPIGTFIVDSIYLETGGVLMGGLMSFGSSPFSLTLPSGTQLGMAVVLGGGSIISGITYLPGGAIFPNGTILQAGTILHPSSYPPDVITKTSLLYNYNLGIQDNLESWDMPSGTVLPGGLSNRAASIILPGGFHQYSNPFTFQDSIYQSSLNQQTMGEKYTDNIYLERPNFNIDVESTSEYISGIFQKSGYSRLINFRMLNYQIPPTSSYTDLPQQMLLIDSAVFPLGASTNGPVLYPNGTVLTSPISFSANTIIPSGTFFFGSLLTPLVHFNGPVLVLGAAVLPPSTTLKSSTTLPPQTILPGGAFLPLGGIIPGSVLYPSGTVIPPGTNLPSSSFIKPGAILTNGLLLPGGGYFPGGIIIPNGQVLPPITVPAGTIFPPITTLLGSITLNKGGALLPGGAIFGGNNTVPPDSQLLSGAILSQGTVFPGGIVLQATTSVLGGLQLSPLQTLSEIDINNNEYHPSNNPTSNSSSSNNQTVVNSIYITAQVNITNFYYNEQSENSFEFFKNLFLSTLASSMGVELDIINIISLAPAVNPYNVTSNSYKNPSLSLWSAVNNQLQSGISVIFGIKSSTQYSSVEDIVEALLDGVIQNPSSSFNRIFSWVGFMILTERSPNFWNRHLRGAQRLKTQGIHNIFRNSTVDETSEVARTQTTTVPP